MAEALISAVLDQLVPFLSEQPSLVTDAENEFRSFNSTLEAIQAVLKDADRKQVQDASVKRWLDQLKDVSYDMDAVLDEWNTKLGDKGKKAEKALLLKQLEFEDRDKLEALPNFLRKTPLKNLDIDYSQILKNKCSEYVNVEEVVKILTSESGDGGENAERWRHEERLEFQCSSSGGF